MCSKSLEQSVDTPSPRFKMCCNISNPRFKTCCNIWSEEIVWVSITSICCWSLNSCWSNTLKFGEATWNPGSDGLVSDSVVKKNPDATLLKHRWLGPRSKFAGRYAQSTRGKSADHVWLPKGRRVFSSGFKMLILILVGGPVNLGLSDTWAAPRLTTIMWSGNSM